MSLFSVFLPKLYIKYLEFGFVASTSFERSWRDKNMHNAATEGEGCEAEEERGRKWHASVRSVFQSKGEGNPAK